MEGVRIAGLLLLLLCVFAGGGVAVVCFQCNSEYDPRCGDPFKEYSIGFVDCNKKTVPEHLRPLNVTATICRKNVQKVYGKIRVVRGCGFLVDSTMLDGRSCVQRSGTHDVHVNYCACQGDKCNSALAGRRPPGATIFAFAALTLSLLPAAIL